MGISILSLRPLRSSRAANEILNLNLLLANRNKVGISTAASNRKVKSNSNNKTIRTGSVTPLKKSVQGRLG